jgi:Uma2 family endonuclease
MKKYEVDIPVSALAEIDMNKTYSYADYLRWEFDERLELIKGKIFTMSPAPDTRHQEISGKISNAIFNYLENKPCKIFTAPFDVRLPRRSKEDKEIITVLQPDICVICDLTKIDRRGCIGAPDLVVEILSPGNNRKELKNKFEVYEESGVSEYWIIHPEEKTFLKHILDENGKFQPSYLLTVGDEVVTKVLPGFVLNLDYVFAE